MLELLENMTMLHFFLKVIAIIVLLASIGLLLLAHIMMMISGLKILSKKTSNNNRIKRSELPGVSVLKPLKGVDPNLTMNIESFFTMDYPKYELLFCVKDNDDPVIDIVKKLMQKYPKVDSQLVLGGSNVGINPKVNNMNPGYEIAKYELIMISDDKIFILPDTLLDMVDCMDDNVGMVNQLAYFLERPGFASCFEKVLFSAGIIKYLLLYKFVTDVSCNGMSSLIRRKVLDLAGGLKYFGKFIVEDSEMSNHINSLGWKVTFSRQLALQNSGTCNLSTIYVRIKRWMVVSVKYNPVLHSVVYLIHPTTLSLMHTWSINEIFHLNNVFVTFALCLFCYCIFDFAFQVLVLSEKASIKRIPKFVTAWIFTHFFAYYVNVASTLSSEIEWKGHKFSMDYLLKTESLDKTPSNYV